MKSKLLKWLLDEQQAKEHIKQLLTALNIIIYTYRKEKGEE